MTATTEEFLTAEELAALAGVSARTLWEHKNANHLGLRRALITGGRKHLFDAAKCSRYIAVQQKLRAKKP